MRGPDLVRHLTTLTDLHVAGVLSADEFALAKQRLLSSVLQPVDQTEAPDSSTPAVVGDLTSPADHNGSSRPAALLVIGCCMAIATTLWIIGITHGEGGLNQVVTAVTWVVVIGMQAYYLGRIHQTWDLLPTRAQWKLALSAVLFPLVAGVLAGIAVVGAILAAVAWLAWIAITGRVPGSSGGRRGRSADEWPTDFLTSMFGHKVGFMEQFDGTLRDHWGKQRGSITSDGFVYDENSNRVGSFNSVAGTFQNDQGDVIAHINRRTGELQNASGSLIAYHKP